MAQSDPSPEALAPRKPLSFWREAMQGLAGLEVQGFLLAWVVFQSLGAYAWARHLQGRVGHSALPSYWGELLTARDIWEMAEHGGLKYTPVGPWATVVFWGGLAWILWAGWRVQARAARMKPRIAPFLWAIPDALLLGVLPLIAVGWVAKGAFLWMVGFGIPGLAWMGSLGMTLLLLALPGALLLQWWLLRLERGAAASPWWLLGSWGALGRHLKDGFMRMWSHPVQWTLLVAGGALLRVSLHVVVAVVAWRMGGGSLGKVWLFFGLQLGATLMGALVLAWFLRLVALHWRHDREVRREIRALRASVET